ncbi:hypothetical protein FH972_010871 [Carpinus fangiana]|uniref:Uncharacterized protein n=1 Tax=Carpinus fangiana TaxID=176857 RepID=A0A660KVM4_9ROSI|nr:hypothetical protein FH972_010871 [Carpinus fangiana]
MTTLTKFFSNFVNAAVRASAVTTLAKFGAMVDSLKTLALPSSSAQRVATLQPVSWENLDPNARKRPKMGQVIHILEAEDTPPHLKKSLVTYSLHCIVVSGQNFECLACEGMWFYDEDMSTIFLSHGASLPRPHLAYIGRKVHNMGDVDPNDLWVEHRRRYGRYVRFYYRLASKQSDLRYKPNKRGLLARLGKTQNLDST